MNEKKQRMKELVAVLNEASKAYYAQDKEVMSNFEYDKLYDELVSLEQETGMVLSDSPTVHVGYEAVEQLPKERHEKPMLSLAKTKDSEELLGWMQGHPAILSWKLDGLTVVLTYRDGKLAKAVTRGNGEIGEVITNNAKVFKNLPLCIPYKQELILRGEAVISYSDFEKINATIEDVENQYKNPRNLCSGSVRQLNNEITAQRNVQLFVFSLVQAEGVDFQDSREQEFAFLKEQGFQVVEHYKVDETNLLDRIHYFADAIAHFDIPSDGLVLTLDEISYGLSLGTTAKFPRNSIAFKWQDEVKDTILRQIEWSPSRTGLINPVAIFDPVELEGTRVSRASVHNISIMEGLKLGIGDTIQVYKANMIIPQIAENITQSGMVSIPDKCPVCGGDTQIKQVNEVKSLYCTNPSCAAKQIKAFALYVSRDAMNIDGLSEATLEKLVAMGLLHSVADLYRLKQHKDAIVAMEGFGEKSYDNLIESIDSSKKTTMARLLYGLGITGVGVATAKLICRHFKDDYDQIRNATVEQISEIDGIGPVIGEAVFQYFRKEEHCKLLEELLSVLEIEKKEIASEEQNMADLNFVITGSLNHFENRNILKEIIEEKGGKVTGSVTSKTTALINNDIMSSSSKNKKAKDLGVEIITEEEFMNRYQLFVD